MLVQKLLVERMFFLSPYMFRAFCRLPSFRICKSAATFRKKNVFFNLLMFNRIRNLVIASEAWQSLPDFADHEWLLQENKDITVCFLFDFFFPRQFF